MCLHFEEQSATAARDMEVVSLIVLPGRESQISPPKCRYPVIIREVLYSAPKVMIGGELTSKANQRTLFITEINRIG